MHLCFNFDACPMHSPSGFVHLTHQNLRARALFCLNSLAKVNTQLLIYKWWCVPEVCEKGVYLQLTNEKGSLLEGKPVIKGHNFTLQISVFRVGSVGPCLRMTTHDCMYVFPPPPRNFTQRHNDDVTSEFDILPNYKKDYYITLHNSQLFCVKIFFPTKFQFLNSLSRRYCWCWWHMSKMIYTFLKYGCYCLETQIATNEGENANFTGSASHQIFHNFCFFVQERHMFPPNSKIFQERASQTLHFHQPYWYNSKTKHSFQKSWHVSSDMLKD